MAQIWNGQEHWLPASTAAFHKAEPGRYRFVFDRRVDRRSSLCDDLDGQLSGEELIMSTANYFDANRRSWDERVAIHAEDETGFYSVAKVLRGEDKLNAIEARELGDIAGLRVAHLQCHFGLDSFCLERRGADVTGSTSRRPPIAKAREWAETMGLKTRFVEGNVYDARALLDGDSTWSMSPGVPSTGCPTCALGAVVGSLLKPGGYLYLAESHPAILCFEWIDGKIVPHYDWRTPVGEARRERSGHDL